MAMRRPWPVFFWLAHNYSVALASFDSDGNHWFHQEHGDERNFINAADWTLFLRICIGAAPFATCQIVRLPATFATANAGATRTPDRAELLLAVSTLRSDGSAETFTDLYVLSPTGRVIQMLPFNDQGGIYFP